jgi:phosphatidylserine/phosphatidylglycerophosphate/cardiolipin synthase-like enzyme
VNSSSKDARAPRGVRDVFRRRLGRRIRSAFDVADGSSIEPLSPGEVFFKRMAAAIDAATHSVDVEMYLWHDDEVGRIFSDALVRAVRRGLLVRVLVDAQGAGDADGLIDAVASAGADVRVFNPFRFRFWSRYIHRTHKKLLLLDACVGFTGGAGFSLHFSGSKGGDGPWHDRMYEIRGPAVSQLRASFEADFDRWDARCAPCDGPDVTVTWLPPPRVSGGAKLRVLRGWPDAREFRGVLLDAIRAANDRVRIGTPPPPHSGARLRCRGAWRRRARRHPSLDHANAILTRCAPAMGATCVVECSFTRSAFTRRAGQPHDRSRRKQQLRLVELKRNAETSPSPTRRSGPDRDSSKPTGG